MAFKHRLVLAALRPTLPFLVNQIHTHSRDGNLVSSICTSFRLGRSWDLITREFDSVTLTNTVIDRVLLELKNPVDAKCALSFFHWSGKQKGIHHFVQSYCIAIHIVVKAGLVIDAKGLIESVVKRSLDGGDRFCVVDSLLGSYGMVESTPLVFDLLVQAYARMRAVRIGFDVCCYLGEKGFCVGVGSFNLLVHFGVKSGMGSVVWRVYGYMVRNRVYPNEATVKNMVDALRKEGLLRRYVDMVERICGKKGSASVVVNTSLVYRLLEEGAVDDGMVLLKRMLVKNMVVDSVAYSLVVCAKIKNGDVSGAWEVYEEMLKRGFRANSFVYGLFVAGYARDRRVEKGISLMDEMESTGLKPCDETFNRIIEGCAVAGRLAEGVNYCEKMIKSGFIPSCSSFNQLAEKLSASADVEKANSLLTLLLDKGFAPDETTYSHLIMGYEKDGKIEEILKLYYEMEYRSMPIGLLTFTPLIRSLCSCGKLKEAEKYLKIMRGRSIAADQCIYDTLLVSYLQKGYRDRAFELYKEMVSNGLKPTCLDFCDAGIVKVSGKSLGNQS